MPKRILTQEDFDNNPILIELGLQVGNEIDVPEQNELSNDDEGPGGNHPTDPSGKP